MQLFTNSLEAVVVSRPNRFLLRARVGGKVVEAHCPNPGRMEELLLPGREVILERSPKAGRKTRYTLVACRYAGQIIPLYATRANLVARELLLPQLFPEAVDIREVVTVGRSRFDFAVESPSGTALVEVKACTLVEHGTAMFPDAPSGRAAKHVRELADAVGAPGHVVFVVMNPEAKRFVPNVHTDPGFCGELIRASNRLRIHAMSVRASPLGQVALVDADVPVDLGAAQRNLTGGGCYLLVVRLAEPRRVVVGGLGVREMGPGYFVYVGSAMAGLAPRIARHKRKRKKLRWHIDYLTSVADGVTAVAIMSRTRLECRLATEMKRISVGETPGFGCSDCDCSSHLYEFAGDPRTNEEFIRSVSLFRHHHALA